MLVVLREELRAVGLAFDGVNEGIDARCFVLRAIEATSGEQLTPADVRG